MFIKVTTIENFICLIKPNHGELADGDQEVNGSRIGFPLVRPVRTFISVWINTNNIKYSYIY